MMRLRVEVIETTAGCEARYDVTGAGGAMTLAPRLLPRLAGPPWDALIERTAARQASAGDEEALGRALFQALLGNAHWAAVQQAAAGVPLDLHLCLPAAALDLHRLAWELLHDGREFLCLDVQQPVNLMRIVSQTTAALTPLPAPVRALFVLASDLDDAALQEGASFLVFLRHVRTPQNHSIVSRVLVKASLFALKDAVQTFQPTVVHLIAPAACDAAGQPLLSLPDRFNRALWQHHRALDLANALRDAAGNVPPLSLHLGSGRADVAPVFAAQLIAAGVPLTAILSGSLSNYAARLFARGAYEALLSGQSLSAACADGRRAFRQMGISAEAWAGPILVASDASSLIPVFADPALTQQLADLDMQYRQSNNVFCDRFQLWEQATASFLARGAARPGAVASRRTVMAVEVTEPDQGIVAPRYGKTRFLEELARYAVQDNYIPLLYAMPPGAEVPRTLLDLALKLVGKIIEARAWFGLPRLELPRDSEVVKLNLLHRGQQIPIAASAYNTALIRQLIVRALQQNDLDALLYDYFRPVHDAMIARPAADRVQLLIEHCANHLEFAQLFERIAEINPAQFAVFKPLLGVTISAGQGLHPSIQEQYNLLSVPAYNDPTLVAAALRLDLAALTVAARLAVAPAQPPSTLRLALPRVLVLLDDLHRFDEPVVRDLLNVAISNRGLGLADDSEPLPVVFTFSKAGIANDATDGVMRSCLGRVYVLHQELKPFSENEAHIAYNQFLFWRSPFPDPNRLPLVVNSQADATAVKAFFERMRSVVGGVPSRLFNNDALLQAIAQAQADQVLEEVQDDLLLGRI